DFELAEPAARLGTATGKRLDHAAVEHAFDVFEDQRPGAGGTPRGAGNRPDGGDADGPEDQPHQVGHHASEGGKPARGHSGTAKFGAESSRWQGWTRWTRLQMAVWTLSSATSPQSLRLELEKSEVQLCSRPEARLSRPTPRIVEVAR